MFEELSAIIVVNTEVEVCQVEAKDPLAKVLIDQELEGDKEAKVIVC